MAGRTKPNLPSLLTPGDAQNLIPDRTEQELIDAGNEQMGKSGEYTASFLFKRRPEVYKAILHFLKEQMAMRHICSICKVSHDTVTAVATREEEQLQPAKDFFLSRSKALGRMSMERLEELLPNLEARDVAIVAGIMIDKMLLLSGEATVIVAHKKDLPSHLDFNQLIEQLPIADAHEVDANPGKQKVRYLDDKIVNKDTLLTQTPSQSASARPIVTETPAPLTVSQTAPKQ